MVKRINAIKAHTPRIKLHNRAEIDKVCQYISGQSSIIAGEIKNVLFQLQDAILFFAGGGQPAKIDGLGTFTPTIISMDPSTSMCTWIGNSSEN